RQVGRDHRRARRHNGTQPNKDCSQHLLLPLPRLGTARPPRRGRKGLCYTTPGMTFRERALRRPQTLWIRKAVFQIHLWTGIAVGLYIVVASLSGSAVVFRRELMRVLVNRPQVSAHDATTPRLTEAELGAAARRAFPDYTVTKVWMGRNGERPIDIW